MHKCDDVIAVACRTLQEERTMDSATRRRDEDEGMTKSFAHRSVAVGDRWKRHLLHQRIRNWQLCPDSIDKVD